MSHNKLVMILLWLQILCSLLSLAAARSSGASRTMGGKPGRRKKKQNLPDRDFYNDGGNGLDGTNEQRLLRNLFKNYDTDARGVANTSDTVTVQLQFTMLRIQSLDERSQVLTHTGLIFADWHDARLKWEPADYHNLTDIVVHPLRIWLPELALMNGADEQAPDFRRIRALIKHTGDVHWEPGGIFTTTCDIDIQYFPFDEQDCDILIGAWAYVTTRMNLTSATNYIDMGGIKRNGEWEVFGSHAQRQVTRFSDMAYSYVNFTIYLRRRSTFYIMNIVLPCTLLSILVMIVFCLPPDAGEKISLGISVLLAFTVFLLMVAENVPRTSLHVPIMVIYLTCTMALGTCSVCMTVLVLNLHHRHIENKVPRWAKFIVLDHLSRLLCMTPRRPLRPRNMLEAGEMSVRDGIRRIAQDMHAMRPMLTPNGRSADAPGYGDGATRVTNNHVDGYRPLPYENSTCVGATIRVNSRESTTFKHRHTSNRHHHSHHHNSASHHPTDSSSEEQLEYVNEWRELAHVLDRLFFWIVFTFMTLSTLMIILTPSYQKRMNAPNPLNQTDTELPT